jgi:hypothetical protein
VAHGICVSTEPETSIDPVKPARAHAEPNYSFGTHRCEVITRALLSSYRYGPSHGRKPNWWPDFPRFRSQVELQFDEYGLDVFKPCKRAVASTDPVVHFDQPLNIIADHIPLA